MISAILVSVSSLVTDPIKTCYLDLECKELYTHTYVYAGQEQQLELDMEQQTGSK